MTQGPFHFHWRNTVWTLCLSAAVSCIACFWKPEVTRFGWLLFMKTSLQLYFPPWKPIYRKQGKQPKMLGCLRQFIIWFSKTKGCSLHLGEFWCSQEVLRFELVSRIVLHSAESVQPSLKHHRSNVSGGNTTPEWLSSVCFNEILWLFLGLFIVVFMYHIWNC